MVPILLVTIINSIFHTSINIFFFECNHNILFNQIESNGTCVNLGKYCCRLRQSNKTFHLSLESYNRRNCTYLFRTVEMHHLKATHFSWSEGLRI